LVKSKETGASMGFCFLIFSDIQMATKLVFYAYENPISINGNYLSITYSHPNSFVPVCGSSEWVSYSYLDTEYKLVEIAYWDELYYAKEYPKSPPIDPSLIKGKWAPTEAMKARQNLLSDTVVAESQVIVEREPVRYDETKEEESAFEAPHTFTQPISYVSKKKRVIDPKDKTAVQIMKWQERQEELAQPDHEEPMDLSDEALKNVFYRLKNLEPPSTRRD
jgi:hypothetical protein